MLSDGHWISHKWWKGEKAPVVKIQALPFSSLKVHYSQSLLSACGFTFQNSFFFLRLRVRLGLLRPLIDAGSPRPKQLWSHGEDKSYFTTSEDILLLNALLWCKICICHIWNPPVRSVRSCASKISFAGVAERVPLNIQWTADSSWCEAGDEGSLLTTFTRRQLQLNKSIVFLRRSGHVLLFQAASAMISLLLC